MISLAKDVTREQAGVLAGYEIAKRHGLFRLEQLKDWIGLDNGRMYDSTKQPPT